MKLKQTTDYAIRLLLCLHANSEKHTAEELGESACVPKPTVIKIMGHLKSKGWVDSQEGMYGEYRLATGLETISFLDILSAMEDDIEISGRHRDCPNGAEQHSPAYDTYARLQEIIECLFRKITLDKIQKQDLHALERARDYLSENRN